MATIQERRLSFDELHIRMYDVALYNAKKMRDKRNDLLRVDLKTCVPVATSDLALRWLIPEWHVNHEYLSHYRNEPSNSRGMHTDIGSLAEGFELPYVTQRKNKPEIQGMEIVKGRFVSGSDKDRMEVLKTPCVVGPDSANAATHLVLDTSETSPGYMRIKHIPDLHIDPESSTIPNQDWCPSRETDGVSFTSAHRIETYMTFDSKHDEIAHQVKFQNISDDLPMVTTKRSHEITQTGPAVTHSSMLGDDVIASMDTAMALECPYWPEAASEWTQRRRLSGWPPPGLIEMITSKGCHLVKVAHWQSVRPEIEWRFSFVCAEKELARRVSTKQKQCYKLFKLLTKDVVRPHTALSTYCLKTVMFWTLEKIPSKVWHDPFEGLATALFALLDELILCLAERNLPHYFIPQNNLLSGRHPDFLRAICKKIVNFRKDPANVLEVFDALFTIDVGLPGTLPVKAKELSLQLPSGADARMMLSVTLNVNQKMLAEYAYNSQVKDFCLLLNEAYLGYTEQERFMSLLQYITEAYLGYTGEDWFVSLMLCNTDVSRDSTGRFVHGYAWCSYVYEMRWAQQHESHVVDIKRYCELFELAISLHSDERRVALSTVYLSIVLHVNGRSEEAIPKLRKILELTYLLPDIIPKFESFTRPALDSDMQTELEYSNRLLMYPLHALAHYILIRCYESTGNLKEAAEWLEKFKQICMEMFDSEDLYTRVSLPCVFGLLGHCFLVVADKRLARWAFHIQRHFDFSDECTDRHLVKVQLMKRQNILDP